MLRMKATARALPVARKWSYAENGGIGFFLVFF
jgi:hypothetical protein